MDKKAKMRAKKSKMAMSFCIITSLAIIVFLFFTPLISNLNFQSQNGMGTIFSTDNADYITRFSYISVMKNIIVLLGEYQNLSVIAGGLIGAYLFVPFIAMVLYLIAILYAIIYGLGDDGEILDIKKKIKTTRKLFKIASVISIIMFLLDVLIVLSFDIFMFKSMATIPSITVIIGFILAILNIKYSKKM